MQKKKARAKSETSNQSDDSDTHVQDPVNKEGTIGSLPTMTVDISGDEGEDRNEMRDNDNVDSSDEDISTLEDQLRNIDLSLEKLQLEYQRDLDVPGIGR